MTNFVKKFAAVKKANKVDFANYAKREYGFDIDPNTMINTMVKRLHEYKRQALKILALIARYADIKSGKLSADDVMPRTVVFGAKAAPGYYLPSRPSSSSTTWPVSSTTIRRSRASSTCTSRGTTTCAWHSTHPGHDLR